MSIADLLTDSEIRRLISLPKTVDKKERVKFLSSNWRVINASRRVDVQLQAESDEVFSVFLRQSVDDPADFSVGLKVAFRDGSRLNIVRCNGVHGRHRNDMENEHFENECHLHTATERYIQNGSYAEKYAEPTDEYISVEGALEYLLRKCNISVG